ncbi:MAG: hypothetical protein HRT73_12045, partial [Flavobacteriales bacterium]|nr:hypothetical protein [Flavobacteriales bacterium]
MYKIKFYSFLFLIGITFFSCSKENFEAQVPAYISIPSITLTTDYATQGSTSSNIKDAWVFVNDDLVGVYELPAKFPVLKEGNVTVKVFAGIKDNGITADGTKYLLYDPHVVQVNLVKNETVEIVATVSYASSVKFSWLEDFENVSLSFLHHSSSDTVIKNQSTIVKEGSGAGKIF